MASMAPMEPRVFSLMREMQEIFISRGDVGILKQLKNLTIINAKNVIFAGKVNLSGSLNIKCTGSVEFKGFVNVGDINLTVGDSITFDSYVATNTG